MVVCIEINFYFGRAKSQQTQHRSPHSTLPPLSLNSLKDANSSSTCFDVVAKLDMR